jgi:transcriptional regulator with XRE-family HTH domain
MGHACGVTSVAEYLRTRREQLQPADVGLPDSGRRRTPGLRREEVATLAGISIDYLVRLEQGRDTRPSASVIAALADALRLDDDQHRQLSMLARVSQSAVLCPAAGPLTRVVVPTVTALLERLGTTPAFVVGPANDVLAGNELGGASSGPSECSRTQSRTSPATCSSTGMRERSTPTGRRRPTIRWVACVPPAFAGVTMNASPS